MSRPDSRFIHEWHVAINRHSDAVKFERFMYEGKNIADEVPRMVMLFKAEREVTLPTTLQQCSMQEPVPVPDNHLTCCLGVKCRECPALLSLEAMPRSPEEIDQAKAWTCAAHILLNGGDHANEGYVLRVDDRMYWNNVYASLAQEDSP